MSDAPTKTSNPAQGSGDEKKLTLKDYIRKYLFCDHEGPTKEGETESPDAPRMEWTLDNKDRFWRKERDLRLSSTDANALKTLDHAIQNLAPGTPSSSESLSPEKSIEMDFFIKPDGYGPCIVLSYAIPTGPGSMQVVYIGGSFAELAEKAQAGLHRRPVLRTPSLTGTSSKKLCCSNAPSSTSEAESGKTYADEAVQTEKVAEESAKEKGDAPEAAVAIAVASVSEPGDELIVNKLAPAEVPMPENDTHSQVRSDFR